MEASALQAPATLPQTRVVLGTPLLRFRSDEQLVDLFRAGHDEAFRVIHERYSKRLFAYARQMLPGRQDAEDALQDVFVRAYAGLRASNQDLALRAWLFRVAHNRCIDELRRPAPPPPEVLQLVRTTVTDPLAEVDLRESLRRLIEDIRRLPEQQRSALLMRELAGMPYADMATSLGISVGAVKSLLVRARVALAQAAEARDTSCVLIREQLVEAHDHGLRPNANTRKHMRDCVGCKSFRRELRGMSRQLAAVTPAIGPLGVLAKTLGFGKAGGGAAGGGGLALLGGGGATATAGGIAVGVNHVAALLVAAAATAGGAVELQHSIIAPAHHPARTHAVARHPRNSGAKAAAAMIPSAIQAIAGDVEATVSAAPKIAASAAPPAPRTTPRPGPLMGGPVHAPPTSASDLSTSPTTGGASTKTAPKTGGSSPSTTEKTSCSGVISTATTTSSTGPSPSSASDTNGAAPTAGETSSTTQGTCVASSPSSPASSTSSTAPGSSSTGTGTSGSTTSGGTSGSGGSTTAPGSDPSTAGASSTSGAASPAK